MPVVILTQQFIDKELLCPDNKNRIELCDKDLGNFYIEVRKTSPGIGTYYLRYKDSNGKTCHQRIGRTTDLSLYDARIAAKKYKTDIAAGANLRDQNKPTLTFKDFFSERYLPYIKPRKRSARCDETMINFRIVPKFGHLKLDAITRHDIQCFHTELKAEELSSATCDHYVKLIRHALNLAVGWELLEKNPAAKVPLFREDNRKERYLNEEELERLLSVLRTDENRMVCNVALFLLSTGARMNEALHATWSQINVDQRVWRIPASNSKSKKIRSVPLNDSALAVLKDLANDSEFVFINRKAKTRLTCIKKVWDRIRKAAALPELRIHDLRHMYASFLVNDGRSLYEVQQILGHSNPIVTQRYAHLSSKSLQAAANSASVMIAEKVSAS